MSKFNYSFFEEKSNRDGENIAGKGETVQRR